MTAYDVVVPTIGRRSLARLLDALAAAEGPLPDAVVVVDDRRAGTPLALVVPDALRARLRVVRSGGRGPAAARNRGWRAASAPWVAFLDDDVVVGPRWRAELAADLAAAARDGATQGRLEVPLPRDRAPTDWERNVKGLETARWITADFAVRRDALAAIGGFDERFRRAYREDTDLALRLLEAGYGIAAGRRNVVHPVRDADRWISVRLQAGNADDALMDALHGPDWRERVGMPRGRFATYPLVVASAAVAFAAAAVWAVATARFAWDRIAPGPRTRDEIATMTMTSVVIPFAAVAHRARGRLRARRLAGRVRTAILFDRDGTLVDDAPILGDPARVVPLAYARESVTRLRDAGYALGVVSNQEALGRGEVTPRELAAVHERIEELLGPFDVWAVCPHVRTAGCACRKPEPGLILDAARRLGVRPADCIVVGDIWADLAAAEAAGARAILVPNAATLSEEIAAAPVVAEDLREATDLVISGAV